MRIENVLRNKLHDELIEAGIKPISVNAIEGNDSRGAVIEFEKDVDMVLVQQIIDIHDPIPLPEKPTENEMIMLAIADLAELVLGGVE